MARTGKEKKLVSPYLDRLPRSKAEALRRMIAEREAELARSGDRHHQARLRREIEELLALCADDAEA